MKKVILFLLLLVLIAAHSAAALAQENPRIRALLDYLGTDTRTAWYNRNTRIFTKIQRSVDGTGERILVIIGAGHVPILHHLLASSPGFHLVDFAQYMGT